MKSLLDSECVSSMILSRPQYHACILGAMQGPTSSAFRVIQVGAQTVLPLPGNALPFLFIQLMPALHSAYIREDFPN